MSAILCSVCLLALLTATGCVGRPARAAVPGSPAPTDEFRAFWVDGFHPGIRTPQEAAELIAEAKRANINTLLVQVRRRGDALYTESIEPPAEDPSVRLQRLWD